MNSLDFQLISHSSNIPEQEKFQFWIDAVLTDEAQDSELVIRIVDEDEMTQFNEQYRDKKGPTNILSFPFDAPESIDTNLLGDLLVCASVIEKESRQQNKLLEHHWAHIVIHGVLHLLGYDHLNQMEAEEMEAMEIEILKKIKINNPYQEINSI